MTRASRAAVLLLLAVAAAARAQDTPTPAPGPTPAPLPTDSAPQPPLPADLPPPLVALTRPAMVNSSAITAADVALQKKLLGRDLQQLEPAAREQVARRNVAEEILLAQEATRLGVTLTDREVDSWWKDRIGEVPDYASLAASTGTSEERQRDLARRAALADIYLLHRCGLRGEQAGRVPPDPLLVRVVTITPSQLREAFAQNHELFDRPEIVDCDVWTLPDEPALQAAQAALEAGGRPDAEVLQRALPLPDVRRVFPPDVADWLGSSPAGEHRALDTHTLVLITGREESVPARFTDVQQRLRNMLMGELLHEARQHLVDGLREHATYWPPDLFNPPAKPEDKKDAVSGPPADGAQGAPATPAPDPQAPAPAPDGPPVPAPAPQPEPPPAGPR
ncbi:MAG TPA: hypothetical protein VFY71_07150 [Planctomycetota bacterium]|nr:hypothetical protein [Planctomycetota bacterium]